MTGPRGKIPYIEFSSLDSEPEKLADSSLIIERFVSDALLPDLNSDLGPTEKVFDVALRALLEEKLYFYHASSAAALSKK